MDKLIIIRPKEKGIIWVTVIKECFKSSLEQSFESGVGNYNAFFGNEVNGKRNIKHYAVNSKKAVKELLNRL